MLISFAKTRARDAAAPVIALALLLFASRASAQMPGQPVHNSGGVSDQTEIGISGGMLDQLQYGTFGHGVQREQYEAYQKFLNADEPAKKSALETSF